MNQPKPKRVLVLMGGRSAERPVSLKSGTAVDQALKQAGYVTFQLDPADPKFVKAMLRLKPRVDVVFNALHGSGGEDGVMQGFLEVLRLPYTGSGILASALSMNKVLAKELFSLHEIPTPKYQVVFKGQPVVLRLKYPVVVKPCAGGSTIGVTLVKEVRDWSFALTKAWRYDHEALIEEYIPGQELTVSVLSGKALPVIEIISDDGFYDYRAKYARGGSRHIIPPLVSTRVQVEAQRLAMRIHRVLGCRGATRTDFRYHAKALKLFALEINTLPGCTATSLLPEAARAIGLSFPQLVDQLVQEAWIRRPVHGRGP